MANGRLRLHCILITAFMSVSGLFAANVAADEAYQVEVSGIVQVEAIGGRSVDGTAESDISLATIEIGFDAEITDNVSAHILLLHEEDGTDLEVDEGSITIAQLGGAPLTLTAGQMYVPFGRFESHMISDPLTLVLGESRESIIQLGAEQGNFSGSVYSFKGATRELNTSERIKSFGANVMFRIERENLNLNSGISYINNLAESDTIQDIINPPTALSKRPAGIALHTIMRRGPLTMIAEYIGAKDSFATTDLAFNGQSAKPNAYNIEAGYELLIFNKEATLALAFQGSRQAQTLGMPESRVLTSINVPLREQTSLSFEWAKSDDYAINEGGSGRTTHLYTAQLAVEF